MQEIAKLLEANDQEFIDRGLSWAVEPGAKLSAYQMDLNDPQYAGKTFAGIELTEDITPPDGYIRIDHHNDLAYRPAAIRQVADLFDVRLNPWQELVAVNDTGYIPGMEKLGVVVEVIDAVRLADRKAQGVTLRDEKLGQKSIDEHCKIKEGVTIIYSLSPSFTPISDRMYGKANRLLCYNDRKLTYYGPGIKQLAEEFGDLIEKDIAYQGGGDNGYFGLAEDKVEGPIEDWIDRIIKVLNR